MNKKASNGYFGRFSNKPPGNYCVWCLTKIVVQPKGKPHMEWIDEKWNVHNMGFVCKDCFSGQNDDHGDQVLS